MKSSFLRRGLTMVALSALAVVAACESGPTKAEIEAARIEAERARALLPPEIELNDGVAQSAAVYLAFMRDVQALQGGFTEPEAIQAALRRGTAYEPAQLSRGLIAYASIVALQSPEFVAGLRQAGADVTTRQKLVNDIVANPSYASTLPGADYAAGLIFATIGADIDALGRSATSIESDAYDIQNLGDARRGWAVSAVADRAGRLETAKTQSTAQMLPQAEEAARLFAAANAGSGLGLASDRRREGPYPSAIQNALSIAALAALGAGGDVARANTEALQQDASGQFCFNMSKLNLYQCLAASRPSYEDMFCLGRHVVRDLATCTRGFAMPAPIVTVSDPVSTSRAPAIATSPFAAPPAAAQTPVTPPPVRTPAPPPAPIRTTPLNPSTPQSATERLNTTPGD